jgi:hypothetical protein
MQGARFGTRNAGGRKGHPRNDAVAGRRKGHPRLPHSGDGVYPRLRRKESGRGQSPQRRVADRRPMLRQ